MMSIGERFLFIKILPHFFMILKLKTANIYVLNIVEFECK